MRLTQRVSYMVWQPFSYVILSFNYIANLSKHNTVATDTSVGYLYLSNDNTERLCGLTILCTNSMLES